MIDLVREEYESLPESIRNSLTYVEYQWLSPLERYRLVQAETEPDYPD